MPHVICADRRLHTDNCRCGEDGVICGRPHSEVVKRDRYRDLCRMKSDGSWLGEMVERELRDLGVFFGDIKASQTTDSDAVNHPGHYKSGGMEAIDVIEAFGLDFNTGNACKYLLRAGRKGDPIVCWQKAVWYLQRAIENKKKENKP